MTPQTIPFEIHLTTHSISIDQQAAFAQACQNHDAKPLLIELGRGETMQQPMASKVVYAQSLEAATQEGENLAIMLESLQFPISRMKIEVPAFHSHQFPAVPNGFNDYFEWHGKVAFHHPDALLELCLAHGAHLSRNALKNQTEIRFVTLREYGTQTQFETRVAQLSEALQMAGWPIQKQQAEYCIFDSNIHLDKGWLSQ